MYPTKGTYYCPVGEKCKISSPKLELMSKHFRQTHELVSDWPMVCLFCNKVFNGLRMDTLSNHCLIRTKTNEMPHNIFDRNTRMKLIVDSTTQEWDWQEAHVELIDRRVK